MVYQLPLNMHTRSDTVIATSQSHLTGIVANIGTDFYPAKCTKTKDGYEYSVPLPRRSGTYSVHIYHNKEHKRTIIVTSNGLK